MNATSELLIDLQRQFGSEISESTYRDNRRVVVPASRLHEVLAYLKQNRGFDQLTDLTVVDYLEYPEAVDRYGVVYVLTSTSRNVRVVVKTFLNPPTLELPTAYDLWRGADWLEREIYDMFGIQFVGHPDLRRLLMPDEFVGHPLRKDYPLKGYGERHNFPVITRAES